MYIDLDINLSTCRYMYRFIFTYIPFTLYTSWCIQWIILVLVKGGIGSI